jgi:hypothetical protein
MHISHPLSISLVSSEGLLSCSRFGLLPGAIVDSVDCSISLNIEKEIRISEKSGEGDISPFRLRLSIGRECPLKKRRNRGDVFLFERHLRSATEGLP